MVVIFPNQNCCGALHAHSGEMEGARDLAKRNIEAVESASVDVVVNNAGGCGDALKDYHHWFKDDRAWRERAHVFVDRMRDFIEILAELPAIPFRRRVQKRVTYQDSCHLAHGQGIRKQPRDLIRSILGVEYVEMQHADTCCGSAGVYNIVQPEMANKVLSTKMEHVKRTAPSITVTSNPECLMQMKLGIEQRDLSNQVEAMHIVDFLYEAL